MKMPRKQIYPPPPASKSITECVVKCHTQIPSGIMKNGTTHVSSATPRIKIEKGRDNFVC